MTDNNNERKSHKGLIAGIAAALAAGAAYLFGPGGDKRRGELRSWGLNTRREVLARLEEAEEISKERYHEIVDTAVAKFAEEKAERSEQIEELRDRLKSEWREIRHQAEERGEQLHEAAVRVVSEKLESIAEDIAPEEK